MKIQITLAITLILLLNFVSAADLRVDSQTVNNVLIKGIDENATFNLIIKNDDTQDDLFQIYSLVGINMFPKGFFEIRRGQSLELEVTAIPYESTINSQQGTFTFEYQIKGQKTGFYKDFLTIKLLELKDAIEVKSDDISIEDNEATIKIINRENYSFSNLEVKSESDFFKFAKTINLGPKETKSYIIPIEIGDKLSAGEYEIKSEYTFKNSRSEEITNLNYLERGGISVKENSSGFIAKKNSITKTNEGNIPIIINTTYKNNVLSRLFTVFSIKPDFSERNGLFVEYSWEKELGVGESFEVKITTNYTFPFILLIIVLLVYLISRYLVTQKVRIVKRVEPVKTKGGELALKIKLRIKANKDVKEIILTDSLPGHTKLYDKFGSKPDHIDEKSRRISWKLNHLSAGEERLYTYIIYSKINVIGTFELPSASASYTIDGKKEFSYSNKTSAGIDTVRE